MPTTIKEINDLPLKVTPDSTDEIEIQNTGGGISQKITVASLPSGGGETVWIFELSPEGVDAQDTVGVGQALRFHMPFDMILNDVRVTASTAPTGAPAIFDVEHNNVSIFSTLITIDIGETTSVTGTPPYAFDGTPTFLDGDQIDVEINQVGSAATGRGYKITFYGTKI
jgi:hypothetical protein